MILAMILLLAISFATTVYAWAIVYRFREEKIALRNDLTAARKALAEAQAEREAYVEQMQFAAKAAEEAETALRNWVTPPMDLQKPISKPKRIRSRK